MTHLMCSLILYYQRSMTILGHIISVKTILNILRSNILHIIAANLLETCDREILINYVKTNVNSDHHRA